MLTKKPNIENILKSEESTNWPYKYSHKVIYPECLITHVHTDLQHLSNVIFNNTKKLSLRKCLLTKRRMIESNDYCPNHQTFTQYVIPYLSTPTIASVLRIHKRKPNVDYIFRNTLHQDYTMNIVHWQRVRGLHSVFQKRFYYTLPI